MFGFYFILFYEIYKKYTYIMGKHLLMSQSNSAMTYDNDLDRVFYNPNGNNVGYRPAPFIRIWDKTHDGAKWKLHGKTITNDFKQKFTDNITKITASNGIESISDGCFNSITSLKEMIMSDGIKSCGQYAFGSNYNLTNIHLSESLSGISYCMMLECTSLTTITMPQSIERIDMAAFLKCSNLETVNFSDNITYIGNSAFIQSGIKKAILPNNLTYLGSEIFNGCENLEEVFIPESVKGVEMNSFNSCPSLKELTIPDTVENVYGLTLSLDKLYYGGKKLNTYRFSSIFNTVKDLTIGSNAIEDFEQNGTCEGSIVEHVYLPDNMSFVPNSAFYSCTLLGDIIIPDNVTSIGKMAFWCCYSLSAVTLPSSLEIIGDKAFGGGTQLREFIMPDSVTSIGETIFYGSASNLTKIKLSTKLKEIPQSTFPYAKITDIDIPDSITSIGYGAFGGCSKLKSVVIPDSVKVIGVQAFSSCSNLTSVVIGEGVEVMSGAPFYGCSVNYLEFNSPYITFDSNFTSPIGGKITKVKLGAGVSIGSWPFGPQSNVEELTLAKGFTSFVNNFLGNAGALTSIIYEGTISEWNAISKEDGWKGSSVPSTCVVHCEDGNIDIGDA